MTMTNSNCLNSWKSKYNEDPSTYEGRDLIEYANMRRNFIDTIQHRCGIEVTNQEYDALVRHRKFKVKYKVSGSRIFCTIEIKGQTIESVFKTDSRNRKDGIPGTPAGFVTALNPETRKTPVPKRMVEVGWTPELFDKAIELLDIQIEKLRERYLELGDRLFFTDDTIGPKELKFYAKHFEKGLTRGKVQYILDNEAEFYHLVPDKALTTQL